jgi:hypothetical protein
LNKAVFKHQEEETEEAVKDFADIIIKKMDLDKDGIITFKDYSETVFKEPLLLECFGQCLPNRCAVYSFLTTFTDKIKEF